MTSQTVMLKGRMSCLLSCGSLYCLWRDLQQVHAALQLCWRREGFQSLRLQLEAFYEFLKRQMGE